MADHYAQLTEAERAHWDEYTRLRELSDWLGFTEAQDVRRADARHWLVEQRKFIWRCAEGKETPEYKAGWHINQRSERYAQLQDESLNSGDCRRVASLPRNGCTDAEKALLAERCTWWMVSSTNEHQKTRKQACTDWLINRRKELYGLIQESSDAENDANARSTRYENLSIATKHGDAYTNWTKTHDAATGEPKSSSSSSRSDVVKRCRSFLGVKENPAGSNRGSPEIDNWQNRVIGYSGNPWCACFATCVAWDCGAVGGSSAAVTYCMSMAQQHQGIYRGWTTDPSQVLRGDFAVVGCTTCHIGVVVNSDDACHLIEGNGDDGGSYNGGEVVEKHRPRSDIVGWCLVDYP